MCVCGGGYVCMCRGACVYIGSDIPPCRFLKLVERQSYKMLGR